QHNGPSAVRYPRGSGTGEPIQQEMTALPLGRGIVKRQGHKVAILAFGSMVAPALEAANLVNATIADMRFVKPLDINLIQQLASQHSLIVTIEENAISGGAGAAVMESLQAMGIVVDTLCLGLPDEFIEHGVHETMLAACGLNASGIIAAIENKLT
ncbi:MAG: transketolase C-terminal domain-containing protein, partial [Methylophilaceae bacterium]|nr:transketolase C-terminal domain-containing protein [Methylophilaceae bacterium]